jgi:hypothetical protein
VAERVFNELPYDVFLVEWDEPERAGDQRTADEVWGR